MQAQELRIGNLVKYSEDGSLCEVLAVDKLGLSVNVIRSQEITWIEIEHFEPVILTHKLLEKFRFEKGTDSYGGYLSPLHNGGRIRIDANNLWWNGCSNTEVYHVHKLQNLYFALTGQELSYDDI